MNYNGNRAENVKIAYIGGGSRNWAWRLMSDLVDCDDMSGDVYLYDIDIQAAKNNEIIGNKYNNADGAKTVWNYHATETIEDALVDSDFVVISILPGSFDEMYSDVHTPEKYGIYQSVGDSSGPGGIIRAMRTAPMYEYIAKKIKECCPNAWVISYTNPMTLCTKTLYRAFPEIKAFGCCHEVFGTQNLLLKVLEEYCGITNVKREDVKVNPIAVNHFTWLTSARYKNIDIFPLYEKFAKNYAQSGYLKAIDESLKNTPFYFSEKVKFDLFNRYGYIAAAGDRHLAEFCEGEWYLGSPENVKEWGFELTSVDFRREQLKERLAKSERLVSGEEKPKITFTGEEGVNQMRALLGLCELVTNVNLPNVGQIPNLPLGAVVESNAVLSSGKVTPVFAGEIPSAIYPLVSRICAEQEEIDRGIANRDLGILFNAFSNDPLVTCSHDDAKALFKEMIENTKEYLTMYDFATL